MFGLSSLLLTALLTSAEIEMTQQITPAITETTTQQENIPNTTEIEEITEANLVQSIVAEKKLIAITNAIEPSMLAYKHWTGTYSPELFTIMINDTQVAAGETYSLDLSNDSALVVQFDYSFMNGIRKGSKKITYQMNKECTQATLTFSWLDTWKVIIDGATPLKEETI